MRDLYEILEIERNASQDEIKKNYRKMAKKYHPDLNPDNEEASERLKEINLAYEVLSDPDKRSKYDTYGDAIFSGAGTTGGAGSYGGGFGDIFSDIFSDFFGGSAGGGFGQRAYRGPVKGADIRKDITIEFNEAVFGTEKEISLRREETCKTCEGTGAKEGTSAKTCPTCGGSGRVSTTQDSPFGRFVRQSTCPTCHGTGEIIEEKCETCAGAGVEIKNRKLKVKITPGVDNGSIIQLQGEGHAGERGGPNGDLYIVLSVKPHAIFQRQGLDIFYELPISFSQAALGDELQIPVLDGLLDYTIPEETQTGSTFKVKGKGVPSPRGGRVGDLYFSVVIQTPKDLTDRQKELLQEFDEIGGTHAKGAKKGFFDKVKDIFD